MPLNSKGEKIMGNMRKEYGPHAQEVFYASRNAGKISGVDAAEVDEIIGKVNALSARADAMSRLDAGGTGSKPKMIESIMNLGGLSSAQAERAFSKLIEVKALKAEFDGSSYKITHGGFMDRDVLRRAAGVQDSEDRQDSTDRKEVERLAEKHKAKLNMDSEGRVESVTVNGRNMSPLAFAEWARAKG